MVAAIEGVDVTLAVDPDRSAIAEHDLVRDFRPALLDLERPLAVAEHHRHRVSPDRIAGIVSASPAASKSAQLAKLFWIEEGGAGLRADERSGRGCWRCRG